ncbi:NADP-dependent 3-hydroxy acid dehydrogenase YdfG [Polaromonas sp. OV174]|uniref:SDR family oxidoreductase n=1 Tax=Polaromonas sp. OV174 TaxID=1855300 RepID=UPI0008E4A28B|nr:SDR family oxidoreductase [Polaromonas sp. OV174]SFC78862.1 NADP-dependent 3-hydroxy acid dehydrogenase YdfG [Polaromonas sp. OV174]
MPSPEKIALVTGAGTGIGKQVALALMQSGFSVVLAGRRREPLEAVACEGADMGVRSLVVTADVSDPVSVKALFASVLEAFGRLDLLVNNAGISSPAVPLEELSYEDWNKAIGINLGGVFLCTQEAFRIMKAQTPSGGRIINNGSIAATSPRPHAAAYAAAKHAVSGLTKAASLEGRRFNIACGQIDVGNAATDRTERMKTGVLQADGTLAVEPTMDARHVGSAVAYMASLPLDANVPFLTVMATTMPFIGRG